MAIEQLIQQIKKESVDKETSLLAEAQFEATEIIKHAKLASQTEHKVIMQQAEQQALEQKVIESSAKLRAKQIIWQAKATAIKKILETLKKELNDFAKTNQTAYLKVFEKIAKQAISQMDESSVIYCRKQDFEFAKKFGKVSSSPLDCIGGLMVVSADGKIRIDGTFESLIDQKSEELSALCFELLFEDKLGKKPKKIKKVK